MSDDQASAGPSRAEGTTGAAPAPRLVRRAARASRALDPHGIYDARSLARRQLARRRRTLSSLLMLGVASLAAGAFLLARREPRVAAWSPSRVAPLGLDVAALTALPGGEKTSRAIAVARDGRAALVDEQGRAQFWEAGAFSLRAPVLVARGLAIVGGEGGDLWALDLATRRLKWRSRGENAISNRAVFLAALAVRAVPARASTPLASPTPASTPNASGAALASPASAATASAMAPGPSPVPREVREDAVAVGDDGGVVRALRLRDGKTLWSVRLGAPCGGGLSVSRVSGGRTLIFVPQLSGAARRGGIAALDARNGRLAWRYPRDERVFAATSTTPLARALSGRMRLFCADDAGAISALDAATGRSPARAEGEWKTFLAPISQDDAAVSGGSQTPSAPRPFWTRWLGSGRTGASEEPMLVSVRAEPLWIAGARGPRLLVAGNDGGVRALDARSGRLLWSADVGEAPIALVEAPRRREGAIAVIVTPHALERRDAESGQRLSRTSWGADVGRAQAAASTRWHLFVAGRQLQVFDWASAP